MNNIEILIQAKNNILRGNDIESASIILEKCILDGYMFRGERVNILKLATKQILQFIEENKDKENLDYIKENVKSKEENQAYKDRIKYLEEETKRLGKLYYDANEICYKNRDRIKELEKADLRKDKLVANMSQRHFYDREKIRNSIPKSIVKEYRQKVIKRMEGLCEGDTLQYNLGKLAAADDLLEGKEP